MKRAAVAAALALLAQSALASSFRSAGRLRHARSAHTATLLPDGRVLVVGGRGTNLAELAECELFDSKTGRWLRAAPLLQGRSGHTATLLPDGRVLVAGGTTHEAGTQRFVALASVELYDPKTGKWTAGPPLPVARHWHTATLLPDGRVLVAGGLKENKRALDSLERFDSAQGRWESLAPLPEPRFRHQALLLAGPSLLVVGGRTGVAGSALPDAGAEAMAALAALDTAALYDVATNAWSRAPALADPRQLHSAAVLPDGQVLVVGGTTQTSTTNLAELWRPGQQAWRLAEYSLSTALTAHSMTVLPDGRVLVIGGEPPFAADTGRSQVFEPAKGERWCKSAELSVARKGHTATLLPDGRVLVVGGLSAGIPEPSTELWLLAPASPSCEEPPGLPADPLFP